MTKQELNKFTKKELIDAILYNEEMDIKFNKVSYIYRYLRDLTYKQELAKIEEDYNKSQVASNNLSEFIAKLRKKYRKNEVKYSEMTLDEINELIRLHKILNNQIKEWLGYERNKKQTWII